jgi:acetyltransferase-like isoleucine patch superfamily enzyme
MLSEEPFLPNTAQLVDGRKLSFQPSCSFNKAVVPMDSGERGRLFERIVAAEWIYPRAGERQVTGHLGGGISVSAPFYCNYGYNISIGDNAIIGPDCRFRDSGRIAIGKNTKIGARVIISTLEEPTVTRLPKGSKGTETAREVYIGENVHIGDGCTIEAGLCIGNNAIVRAGSVVDQACVHLSSFSENLH